MRFFKVFLVLILTTVSSLCLASYLQYSGHANLSILGQPAEIQFQGNDLLTQEELEELLPARGRPWWYFNTKLAERALVKSSIVKNAQIQSCQFFSFDCYQVNVEEVQPAFILKTKNADWLLSKEVEYIAPVNVERLKKSYPVISDEKYSTRSPQASIARIMYLADKVSMIQAKSKYAVDRARLLSNGEVEVAFENIAPKVVFSKDLYEESQIEKEIKRLKIVLHSDDSRSATKIDLAFNNQAVLSFS